MYTLYSKIIHPEIQFYLLLSNTDVPTNKLNLDLAIKLMPQ